MDSRSLIAIVVVVFAASHAHAGSQSFASSAPDSADHAVLGRVVEHFSRDSMIGATVSLVGTSESFASDINGEFRFTAPHDTPFTLAFQYRGFPDMQFGPFRVLSDTTICLSINAFGIAPISDGDSQVLIKVRDDHDKPLSPSIQWYPPSGSLHNLGGGAYLIRSIAQGYYHVIVSELYHHERVFQMSVGISDSTTIDVTLSPDEGPGPSQFRPKPRNLDWHDYHQAISTIRAGHSALTPFPRYVSERYRFLYGYGFLNNPLIVECDVQTSGQASIRYFVAKCDYSSGTASIIEADSITISDASTITTDANRFFWNQKYLDFGSGFGVIDALEWTVEGQTVNSLHLVTRYSPRIDEPVRRFAWLLVRQFGDRLTKRFLD